MSESKIEIPNKFAFDLEGTLVDLEKFHQKSFEEVAGKLGVEFGPDQFHEFVGAGDFAISREIAQLAGNFDDSIIRMMKNAVYTDLLHSNPIEPREGVTEYLDRARSIGGELVVASLTPPSSFGHILEKSKLSPFFFYLLTNDKPKFKKPNPFIYETAARVLWTPNKRMLVHEDSPPGVKSGKTAGSPVAAFPVHDNLQFDPEPDAIFFSWKGLDPMDTIQVVVKNMIAQRDKKQENSLQI